MVVVYVNFWNVMEYSSSKLFLFFYENKNLMIIKVFRLYIQLFNRKLQ